MSYIDDLDVDIRELSSGEDFAKFTSKYNLNKTGEDDSRNATFYTGRLEGNILRVNYSWKDPSKAFSIKPDRNYVEAIIEDSDGNIIHSIKTMYED